MFQTLRTPNICKLVSTAKQNANDSSAAHVSQYSKEVLSLNLHIMTNQLKNDFLRGCSLIS